MGIVRKTIAEQIVEYVLEQIDKGVYKPGDRLPSQEELSKELQVSRVSIREALVQLQSMGIVDIRQGEGTFVSHDFLNRSISNAIRTTIVAGNRAENLRHLLEVRRIVEQHTVELAVLRREDEKISPLGEIIREMATCVDSDEFLNQDLEFHLQIARASGNPLLFRLLEMIRHTFWDDLRAVMEIPGLREKAVRYHQDIYEAIKSGDKERAVELMLKHLEEPERTMLERRCATRRGG